MGDRHRLPPGRGRQHQQRRVALRARPEHHVRRVLRRRLRPLQPLPLRHRAAGLPGAQRLPLLPGVEPHRAGPRRVLRRRHRPLPRHAARLPRARAHPDRHLPPLHLPGLAHRPRRLGGRGHARALRPLLPPRHRRARRHVRPRLHHERAQPRHPPARDGPVRGDPRSPAEQPHLGRRRPRAGDDGGQGRRLPAVGHAGGLRGQGRRPPGRRRGHQGGRSRDEGRLDPGQLRLPRRPRRRGARGAHDRGEQSALPAGEPGR